jgi:hypothetical protein
MIEIARVGRLAPVKGFLMIEITRVGRLAPVKLRNSKSHFLLIEIAKVGRLAPVSTSRKTYSLQVLSPANLFTRIGTSRKTRAS